MPRWHQRIAVLSVLVLGGATGCRDSTAPVTAIDRVFGFAGCNEGTVAPPCVYYSIPSHTDRADSGSLVFSLDNTFEMIVWETITSNPCYSSGGTCVSVTQGSDTARGTYVMVGGVVGPMSLAHMTYSPFGVHPAIRVGDTGADGVPEFVDFQTPPSFGYFRFRPATVSP
jgi:hypothetical protein